MTDQRTPDPRELWQQEASEAAFAPRPKSARVRHGTPRRAKRKRSALGSVAGYAGLALLCVCLGVAAFLVVAAPVDLIRDRVVEHVRDRAGRDLIVAGGTSVSLFPRVTVALGDVSLAAPQDMPGEPMLSVGALEVEVGYWSLLTGRPKAQRVVLHRPVIELSVDGDGRRSWDFAVTKRSRGGADAAPAKDEASGGSAAAKAARVPEFGEVHIVEGTVRYRNARSGAQYELAALTLHASGESAGGPLRIDGSAVWRGERVAFAGTASPASALAEGRPAQLALTLKASALEAGYEGSLVIAGGAQIEGKVSLSSPSLRALRGWLSKASPGEGEADPLAATALVTASEGHVAVSSLELTAGASSARGTFDVEIREGRPHVSGKLMVSELDMGGLLVRSAKGVRADTAAAARPQAAAPSAPPAAAPRSGRGWRDDPIDLALLRLADADVALSVGRLAYKDMTAGPGRLSLAMKGGITNINLETVDLYGGRGKGVVTLDATGEVPVVSANLALVSVSMPGLLGDALGFEWLDGRGNVTLALAGQGQTERQIVEGLNGKLDLAVADGAMVGADVGKIIGRLQQGRFTNLTPAPGDRTPFTELAAKFEIVNGVATSRDMRLVSAHVRLDGEGTFQLGERQMNCELRAKISGGKRGEGAALNVGSLEIPVTISGPWERPTYGIKGQEQILDTVKQIGKRLKSNDVDETIRGLIGGDKEERAKAREKGRELLEKFLKKD